MIIIPAVDLKGGRCVRLWHGESDKETVYSDDPVSAARAWTQRGAQRLHVIDLDGAFEGQPKHLEWVAQIKKETKAFIQMGGGLRTASAIEKTLAAGIDRVILGTMVFTEPALALDLFTKYGNRIMVAIDVKDGHVSIRGWKEQSALTIDKALLRIEDVGGKEVIFTDISRDGTLEGVNVTAVQEVMNKTPLKVFASGGVATLEDVRALISIGSPGCVIGKALYEGKLKLQDAIALAEGRDAS